MPETSRTTHEHRRHTHSRAGSSKSIHTKPILEPVFYFTGAIIMLILSRLMHLTMLPLLAGALSVTILAVSKNWRLTPGIPFSMVFNLMMLFASVWDWIERSFKAVLTAEISSNTDLFIRGLIVSLILTILFWTYHRLFRSVQTVMVKQWFVKKTYVIFFKLLFYFQSFLLFFWVFAFGIHKAQALTRLGADDSTMIAGALALLASGIPAIVYISKGSAGSKKRHRYGRHHRHERNELPKNSAAG